MTVPVSWCGTFINWTKNKLVKLVKHCSNMFERQPCNHVWDRMREWFHLWSLRLLASFCISSLIISSLCLYCCIELILRTNAKCKSVGCHDSISAVMSQDWVRCMRRFSLVIHMIVLLCSFLNSSRIMSNTLNSPAFWTTEINTNLPCRVNVEYSKASCLGFKWHEHDQMYF